VAVNLRTNDLNIFVSDVGEYDELFHKGKLSGILNQDEFIRENPAELFSKLLKDDVFAREILQLYKEQNPVKLEFMDLIHRACVSLAFTDFFGGWYREPEWARRKFVKNSFNDKFMKIKLYLDGIMESYKEIRKENLFNWDEKSKRDFVNSLKSLDKKRLSNGVDISYQGGIDNDLFYLHFVEEKREIFSKPEITPEHSLPKLNFLDDYFERRSDKHTIRIFGDQTYKDESFQIEAEVDLETWVKVGMSRHKPFLSKGEIKMVFLNNEPIQNFDFEKIKLVPDKLGIREGIYYVYEDQIFYRYYTKSEKHFKKLKSEIKS